MTDDRLDKLHNLVLILAKQLPILDSSLAELRASVNVLKVCLAAQMSPGDPETALKQFRVFEKNLLDADPDTQERKRAVELIDALQQWKSRGMPPPDS